MSSAWCRPACAAALAALTLALTSGCTADVTKDRVEATFGRTFTNLYRLQLRELGRRLPAPIVRQDRHGHLSAGSFYTHTRCHKGAPLSAQHGAGDWTCIEDFQRPNGIVAEADYDLSVQTDGCLVATGPAQVVGPPQLTTPAGHVIVNPLSQLYACFETS